MDLLTNRGDWQRCRSPHSVMDSLEDKAEQLWADLASKAGAPIDLEDVVDLFNVVRRASTSDEAASRLGSAHGVVRLAADVVAGTRTLAPDDAALAVVVAASLASPDLPQWWFGYNLEGDERAALARAALAEFGPYLDGPRPAG